MPFDFKSWTDNQINDLTNIPTDFDYSFDNKPAIKKWRELLGNTKPTHDYKFEDIFAKIEIIEDYYDLKLRKQLFKGEIVDMKKDRASVIINAGYAKEI